MDFFLTNRIAKIIAISTNFYFFSALRKGVAAGTEHISVLQSLNCCFVVDIGANRGQFALVARRRFPSAKIVSFEPLAEPASIFRRVFADDPLTTLYELAVGLQEQETNIHISNADDSSSLLPITSLQTGLFPGTGERGIRKIQVKRLDSILHRGDIVKPALLKIDVQGFELNVLQGCEDILNKFSHLYIECSFIELYEGQALAHQVIAWLEQRGFILSGVHNLYYEKNGRAVQGDFLFSKKDSGDK